MNSIYFIEIKVVMSEHHFRYGCKNVVNIDFVIVFRLPQISFSNTAIVYTQHFTLMVNTSSKSYRYAKIASKWGSSLLLYNLGRGSNLIGGHYNILEYSQTMIIQI